MYEIESIFKENIEIKYGIIYGGDKVFVMLPGISLSSILTNIKGIEGAYQEILKDYTIYVFDHAEPENDDYTMDEMVSNIIYAIDKIGINNATIYGVSIGALIALKMALIRKDLISKLVLVAGAARVDEQRLKVLKHWEEMSNNYEIEGLNKDFFVTMFTSDYVSKNLGALDTFIHNGTRHECECFSRVIRTMYDFDISNEIENINIPSFVIGSDLDPIFGEAASREIAEKMNGCLFIYKGYSHAFYDEAPDFKHLVMSWLSKDSNTIDENSLNRISGGDNQWYGIDNGSGVFDKDRRTFDIHVKESAEDIYNESTFNYNK